MLRRALAIREEHASTFAPDDRAPDGSGPADAPLHSSGPADAPNAAAAAAAVLPENVASGLGNALNNVGEVLQTLGRAEEGLDHCLRALAVREAALGKQHPATAMSYNNVALAYHALGRTEDAVESLTTACALLENVLGELHPRVATTYHNLAIMQEGLGRFDDALRGLERSLRIKEATLPPNHPAIARTLMSMGNLYFTGLGQPEKTLELYQRALDMRRISQGDGHPDVGDSHFNMAALSEHLGRAEEALQSARQALAIYEAVYDSEHGDVTSSRRQVKRLEAALSAET